jgi:hypothetical protein
MSINRDKNCEDSYCLNIFCYVDQRFSESVILSGEVYYDQLLKAWIGGSFTHASLCWRATRDGWAASTFHSKCDNKKPTVTLVKVGSYIFGGYATKSWEGETILISLLSIIYI